MTTYFSQLGGLELWRGQHRLGTQQEPKFILVLWPRSPGLAPGAGGTRATGMGLWLPLSGPKL